MWNAILAALRTSEFWAFVALVAVETLKAPIPDEFKLVAPVYIALRIAGKVAQFVFPNGTNGKWLAKDSVKALVLVAALAAASPAMAQVEPIPVTKVSERTYLMVNGGGMFLTQGKDWSGASLGTTLVYNLHQDFSVFGGYDHGFALNDVDGDIDLWRVIGNVRIHPNALVGFGYAWFDKETEGGVAQLMVYKKVAKRLYVNGMYAHVFSRDDLDDFEYARVFLNFQLLGKL